MNLDDRYIYCTVYKIQITRVIRSAGDQHAMPPNTNHNLTRTSTFYKGSYATSGSLNHDQDGSTGPAAFQICIATFKP